MNEEELIEALRPFAEAFDKAQKSMADYAKHFPGAVMSGEASPGWGITYNHLKRAREVFDRRSFD